MEEAAQSHAAAAGGAGAGGAGAGVGLGIGRGSGRTHAAVKQEKRLLNGDSSCGTDEEAGADHQHKEEDMISFKDDAELESAKAEMGEVMEENQRLKSYLEQTMKDYRALQTKFFEFARQGSITTNNIIPSNYSACNTRPAPAPAPAQRAAAAAAYQHEAEPNHDLVCLSLGRSMPSSSIVDNSKNNSKSNNFFSSTSEKGKEGDRNHHHHTSADHDNEGSSGLLALGLDRYHNYNDQVSKGGSGGGGGVSAAETTAGTVNSSTENNMSHDLSKDDEATAQHTSPSSSKMIKDNARPSTGDDEVVQQPPVKKARVSVRARCDTPTMNDGCQWRKYGQKIAKGNPCPRAYYRCTVAPSCPVRKQVQRCAEDMSILITTYEGTHNHPLPISATAMASTTSAAAYMLMSGSSTSSGLGGSNLTTANTGTPTTAGTSAVGLHGINNYFNYLHDDSRSAKTFLLPTATASSISPSPSHPTITLDLTASSTSTSSSTSQLININGRSPIMSSTFAPRYSTANLTFNSSELSSSLPAITWPNSTLLSYNNSLQPNYNNMRSNHAHVISSNINGRHPLQASQDTIYQTLLQKSGAAGTMISTNINPNQASSISSSFPDTSTIAAAAKALTSDPSFHSVLTAALSSFISGGGTAAGAAMAAGNLTSGSGSDHGAATSGFAQKLKWVEATSNSGASAVPAASSSGTPALNLANNGSYGSSFLSTTVPPSTNSLQSAGTLGFRSSALSFPTSKSSSASPDHNI
ncbi:WRKY transcription factor [Dionaea muscipula]